MADDRYRIPEKYHAMVEKAASGRSRKWAIRLKCLDCCCWQAAEVRRCHIDDCALWPYRLGGKVRPAEHNEEPLASRSAPGDPT